MGSLEYFRTMDLFETTIVRNRPVLRPILLLALLLSLLLALRVRLHRVRLRHNL